MYRVSRRKNFVVGREKMTAQKARYNEITYLNLKRINRFALLGIFINPLLSIGLDFEFYFHDPATSAWAIRDLFLIHIPITLFLIAYYWLTREKALPDPSDKQKSQWIIYSFTVLVLAGSIALSIYNLMVIGNTIAYFLVVSFIIIGLYWNEKESLLIYLAVNIIFLISTLAVLQDPSACFHLFVASLIFTTVFYFLQQNIYQLKVREIKNLERSENKASTLLERNNELDEFVYKASHDLRAPLNSIMALIKLTEKEDEVPVIQDNLALIKSSAFRLDSFIRSLLQYSRIGSSFVKAEKIDFHNLLAKSLEEIQHLEGINNIKKTVNIRVKKKFYSDPLILSTIINNLLSNAVKYHNPYRDDNRIEVEIDNKEEGVQISVHDNGIGIDAEKLQHIFEKFYRAHEHSQGTGLGLFIVKQNVDKLDGKISVESMLGEGTRFVVYIPNLVHVHEKPSYANAS